MCGGVGEKNATEQRVRVEDTVHVVAQLHSLVLFL